ncbi:MAG: alpha/beta fold hydrolase [Rhodospirillales bacterium]|nr:alpha/beta fold hydrolase [Rhodospirillales bacterium]
MDGPELRLDGPANAALTIALAHGAGAPMDSPFMASFAGSLAEEGFRVARFEFPYMAQRRKTGRRSGPDRPPVLLATWRAVIDALGPERLVIGGKSLGGRIASMVADDAGVRGLLCLGYPFHPPDKADDQRRIQHLRELRAPCLIVQGERDPFGSRAEVANYPLSSAINVHWLGDGDHGFKPRKASGRTEDQNLKEALDAILAFLARLSRSLP